MCDVLLPRAVLRPGLGPGHPEFPSHRSEVPRLPVKAERSAGIGLPRPGAETTRGPEDHCPDNVQSPVTSTSQPSLPGLGQSPENKTSPTLILVLSLSFDMRSSAGPAPPVPEQPSRSHLLYPDVPLPLGRLALLCMQTSRANPQGPRSPWLPHLQFPLHLPWHRVL